MSRRRILNLGDHAFLYEQHRQINLSASRYPFCERRHLWVGDPSTLYFRLPKSFTAEITGRIIENIYAIRQKSLSEKVSMLAEFDSQLKDWTRTLPVHLRLDQSSGRSIGPNVLRLHMQHSASVILLHRKLSVTPLF